MANSQMPWNTPGQPYTDPKLWLPQAHQSVQYIPRFVQADMVERFELKFPNRVKRTDDMSDVFKAMIDKVVSPVKQQLDKRHKSNVLLHGIQVNVRAGTAESGADTAAGRKAIAATAGVPTVMVPDNAATQLIPTDSTHWIPSDGRNAVLIAKCILRIVNTGADAKVAPFKIMRGALACLDTGSAITLALPHVMRRYAMPTRDTALRSGLRIIGINNSATDSGIAGYVEIWNGNGAGRWVHLCATSRAEGMHHHRPNGTKCKFHLLLSAEHIQMLGIDVAAALQQMQQGAMPRLAGHDVSNDVLDQLARSQPPFVHAASQ